MAAVVTLVQSDSSSHEFTSSPTEKDSSSIYSMEKSSTEKDKTPSSIDNDSPTTTDYEYYCPQNEEFSKCVHSICRAQFCSQKGLTPFCRKKNTTCTEGCVCKENFLRNNDGICIPTEECNTTCGEDEKLDRCPRDCTNDYCATREQDATNPECGRNVRGWCQRPVCKCDEGYKRADNGSCIPKEACPAFPCNENEEYKACQLRCANDDCNPGPFAGCLSLTMTLQHMMPCYPRCMCMEGFKRTNGTCVPTEKCPNKKKKN